jgi:hypothetical protein
MSEQGWCFVFFVLYKRFKIHPTKIYGVFFKPYNLDSEILPACFKGNKNESECSSVIHISFCFSRNLLIQMYLPNQFNLSCQDWLTTVMSYLL